MMCHLKHLSEKSKKLIFDQLYKNTSAFRGKVSELLKIHVKKIL